MKNLIKLSLLLIFLLTLKLQAQTLTFERISPPLIDTVFNAFEIVSYANITNHTSSNIQVFFKRITTQLPQNWFSAFCFSVCYPPDRDTATEVVSAGSHEFTLHFYVDSNYTGTAYVTMIATVVGNPSQSDTVIFGARTNPVGIKQLSEVVEGFKLNQNYPNPFNPNTKIGFSIPKAGYADLRVYDILGREVKVLLSQQLNVGEYEIEFDAKNLASGMYYYRLQSGENVSVKKMTLVK